MIRFLAVAAALVACSNDKAKPRKRELPVIPPPPPDIDAGPRAPIAPPSRDSWDMDQLAPDGQHVRLHDMTYTPDGEHLARGYRVIDADTDTIVTDLRLPAMSALPLITHNDDVTPKPLSGVKLGLDTPGLSDDLIRAGAFLKNWPLGEGMRIAASPDGSHVAFAVGSWIYTAVNGTVQGRVSDKPAYEPLYLPDGTLVFRQQTGVFDREDPKHELFAMPPGGKPTRLAGTAGFAGASTIALTKDSVRGVISDEPYVHTCIIDIALAAPHTVKQLYCLDGKQELASVVAASRTARYFAIVTYAGKQTTDLDMRVRVVDLDMHKIVFDRRGDALVGAVGDDGTLVFNVGKNVTVVSGGKQASIPITEVSVRMFFRDEHHLITAEDGDVRLLEIPPLR